MNRERVRRALELAHKSAAQASGGLAVSLAKGRITLRLVNALQDSLEIALVELDDVKKELEKK